MKTINTIRGTKNLADCKRVLAHEHLLIDITHEAVEPKDAEAKELFYSEVKMENLGVLRRNPYIIRENLILSDENDAINEIKFLKNHNVDLLLDLTSIGIGRDMAKLKKIQETTDIDIVVGTGFFVHDALDEKYSNMSAEEMAEILIKEIEVGIEDSGIKAGAIGEVGVSEKIYPVERNSIIAAAIAHKKTGLPIYLHTYPWSWAGLDAVNLLIENGVPGKSICVCHIDVTFDYEYLKAIMATGAYIEFDNCGKEYYFEAQEGAFAGGPFATDVERVAMLKKLVADGYGKQVIISNDVCLKASLHKYGGWGYDHIFTNIVPMMRQEKMAAEDIKMIADENPIRFLMQE